jgi:hypothetical protein
MDAIMLTAFRSPACVRHHLLCLALVATVAGTAAAAAGAGTEAPEASAHPGDPAGPAASDGLERPPPLLPGRLDAHLARLAATADGHGPLFFAPAALPPDRLVPFYARARDGMTDALLEEIRTLGGRAQPVSPSILAARLPASALSALARSPRLDRAEAALPRRPLLDVSVPEIGANRVVAGDGLAHPLTGEGVVLGLVDTGLDYQHPAFRGPDGLPRVHALWDQTADGEPPPGQTVGRLCAYDSLVDSSCPARTPPPRHQGACPGRGHGSGRRARE